MYVLVFAQICANHFEFTRHLSNVVPDKMTSKRFFCGQIYQKGRSIIAPKYQDIFLNFPCICYIVTEICKRQEFFLQSCRLKVAASNLLLRSSEIKICLRKIKKTTFPLSFLTENSEDCGNKIENTISMNDAEGESCISKLKFTQK